MSGDPDTIREITARAQAVIEQDCDMGDDGGPCDDCLAQRALRDDSLWLLDRLAAVEAQRDELARALARACYLADHLLVMVPREVWRDSGGDDGQGHYEGDYHAEKVAAEILELAALAAAEERT